MFSGDMLSWKYGEANFGLGIHKKSKKMFKNILLNERDKKH